MDDSMLVGLFWFPDGSNARSRGWPLNRLTMSQEGVALRPSTPNWLPPREPELSYGWDEVTKVERTKRGLRFRFSERGKTFVVGSPTAGARLAAAAQALCPDRFDATIHRVTPWRWDPAE